MLASWFVARIGAEIHALISTQREGKAHIANVSRCCDPATALGPWAQREIVAKRDLLQKREIGMERATSTF
jgi:hypothetical protein